MTLPKRDEFGRFLKKKKKSGPKNPTWEERKEFYKEARDKTDPWSHWPRGW